jgi:hypothetical protein
MVNFYVESLTAEEKCNACKGFILEIGHLLVMDLDTNSMEPLLWADSKVDEDLFTKIPSQFSKVIQHFYTQVKGAKILKLFAPRTTVYGKKHDGVWMHLSTVLPQHLIPEKERKEFIRKINSDLYPLVLRILAEVEEKEVKIFQEYMKTNQILYTEKYKQAVRFFLRLKRDLRTHSETEDTKSVYILQTLQSVSPGVVYPFSAGGLLRQTLDQIRENKPFAEIKESFELKANPANYMRSTTFPKQQLIKHAEKRLGELGVTKSDLTRRFATWKDIPEEAIRWKRSIIKDDEKKIETLFSGLTMKEPTKYRKITMRKFLKTVVPLAKTLDIQLESGRYFPFYALIAGEAKSKPLLRWHDDTHESRVSFYTWPKGSRASQWSLQEGSSYPISHILTFPHNWHKQKSPDKRFLLVLPNCKDQDYLSAGGCLYPECLKPEFYDYRAVINQHNKTSHILNWKEDHICGIGVSDLGDTLAHGPLHVQVFSENQNRYFYEIDRME